MLRRKLLLILGPLVVLLLLTGVAAIALLQNVLADLRHIKETAWVISEDVNALSITINAIEVHLYELQTGRERHLDLLIDDVEVARRLVDRMGDAYICRQPPADEIYRRIRSRLPEFQRHVAALATVEDPELARRHNEAALIAAVAMRQDTLPLARIISGHVHAEQEAVVRWFRWLVLGLSIVFLMVINISVIVLLRAATTVLRPVDRLVEATRQLGQEHYDYRVNLGQHDEFDQLAQAYNRLAEQLQSNEQRRMEMLAQVALTMNHEINNAVAIIELQLRLMSRQANGSTAMEKPLREIQQSLNRLTRTVQSLKNVRRIVLTDYVDGVKMLDLERSAASEQPPPEVPGGAGA